MDRRAFRKQVLQNFGATGSEIDELLQYNANCFDHSAGKFGASLPLEDEAFVPVWEEYAEEAKTIGVFEALQKRLIQLHFPVQQGMNHTKAYQQAVKRGIFPGGNAREQGLRLVCPEQLQLRIHQTPAGKIPVLIAHKRKDFVNLLQALALRNEPRPVPSSQGAVMIAGYNNWDRIRRVKAQIQREYGKKFSKAIWLKTFRELIPQKDLYQDKFILLSREYYSGVSPEQIGLDEEEWREKSLLIRLEHECAHYVTKRFFGSMRNNLLDELIADCAGIVATTGYFNAEWFLTFMGLERYPAYREGGRLQNYRGTPPLSNEAFKALQRLVYHAAKNIEAVTRRYPATRSKSLTTYRLVMALTRATLEELAYKGSIQQVKESPEVNMKRLKNFQQHMERIESQEELYETMTKRELTNPAGELTEEELEQVAGGINWFRFLSPHVVNVIQEK